MADLEVLLRTAVEKGLTHVSLYSVDSNDGKRTYWAARATPSTGHQYVSANGGDPAEVLAQVLQQLPQAPKRAPTTKPRFDSVNPPISELAQRAVTEAVTEDDPPEPDNPLNEWLPKA